MSGILFLVLFPGWLTSTRRYEPVPHEVVEVGVAVLSAVDQQHLVQVFLPEPQLRGAPVVSGGASQVQECAW